MRHIVVGQTAGPIGTKLGTRIHRDPGSALGKSRLRSECRRRESGAAVGADSLRQEDVYRRALGGAHVPPTKAKIRKLGKFDAP